MIAIPLAVARGNIGLLLMPNDAAQLWPSRNHLAMLMPIVEFGKYKVEQQQRDLPSPRRGAIPLAFQRLTQKHDGGKVQCAIRKRQYGKCSSMFALRNVTTR